MTSFQRFRYLRAPEIEYPVADILKAGTAVYIWFVESKPCCIFPVDIAKLSSKLSKCEESDPECIPFLIPLVRMIECASILHNLHKDELFTEDDRFRFHADTISKSIILLVNLYKYGNIDISANEEKVQIENLLNDIKAMPPRPDNKTDEEIAVAEVYRLIDAPNATRPCDRNLNFPVLIDIVTNFFNTPDYSGPVMIEELALAFLQGWHMNHTYDMAAWKKEHREMLTNGLYNYRERLLADE